MRGCEGANRDLGSCLAQRPALLLFWGVWLPRRRRGPRVKRERRHPMCITKNARQQATTQPRSHSRAPPLEGGRGLHHPPTPTAATLSDPWPPPSEPEPRSPSSPDGDSRRAKRVPSPALPSLARIYWADDKRLFGSSRLQAVPDQGRAMTRPSPTVLRRSWSSRAYSPAAIGSCCARGRRAGETPPAPSAARRGYRQITSPATCSLRGQSPTG